MKRYTVVSAVWAAVMIGAVAAPIAGATPQPVKAKHHAKHSPRKRMVSFYATVVRASARGLIVRSRSGKLLRFSPSQIVRASRPVSGRPHRGRRHRLAAASDAQFASGPVVINIVGLQPGTTVLITETIAPDGTITITITLPPAGSEDSISGTVTNVESDVFDITIGDGSDVRLHMAADQLSNLGLQTCDTVDVSYHQDDGLMIVDGAQVTGTDTSGDCAPTYDATGAITQVSDSSITINSDQGPMTFNVSSSDLTAGFQNGDVVDVTYTQNSDGSMDAVDVQYVEQDATGTVQSVSSGSLTITDSNTGQPDTFVADPSNGLQINGYAFDGVHKGDQVGVTYHQTANGLVADCVDDQSSGS